MTIQFTSLGGAGTVTGSKHLLEADGLTLLVDCGVFQGLKVLRERNWDPFPIAPERIDTLILTHAHLDHSGYLPKLVREGFQGPVFCSEATADLTKILLKDSADIAERDAEYANRKGFSKHAPALPLYTVRDAERALKALRPTPFDQSIDIGGARLQLHRAGHILGAAIVELHAAGIDIVFSGDLGRYGDPMMPAPARVTHADYIVVESTYGDRVHPKTDPMESLANIVERTVRRGGTIVIPAFTVGRTQLLLFYLWQLKQSGRLNSTPIFLDSPMAIETTQLLRSHMSDHLLDAAACDGASDVATYVSDVDASKALSTNAMPKIIIAGSGMATGGRVVHHIRTFGPDAKNTILFAGYQAPGTRGARLLGGEKELKMFGQWVPIHAEIEQLPQLSAHADADEIMQWLAGFEKPPRGLFIVHGEPVASDALRTRVARELGWSASVVDPTRSYGLE